MARYKSIPRETPTASGWARKLIFWRREHPGPAPYKSWLRQNAESLLLAVGVALVVRSSVVEAFWVPSGSMLPTIEIGDHLFVNKLAYGMYLPFVRVEIAHWNPVQRGHIVVFTSPVDHETDLIKRIVAIEGDKIEVRHKRLFINGETVEDLHAHFTDPNRRDSVPRDNFGPVTVPPGKFFVMGDNRDQSYDSRFWGFADVRDVKGKATLIYWSWNSRARWLRWERLGRFLR